VSNAFSPKKSEQNSLSFYEKLVLY